MFNKTIKVIKFLVGWPLSILALIFLWHIFTPQFTQVKEKILQANLYGIGIAILSFLLYYLFRVLLWKRILKARGHRVPLSATAWLWSVAELNRYIPGNIWSIVSRGAAFGKYGIKQSTLLFAWTEESLLVALGSAFVGLFGLSAVFVHVLPLFPLKTPVYFIAIFVVFCIALVWIFQNKLQRSRHDVRTSVELLFLACLSFFFFGLGTYSAIVSLAYLPIEEVMMFIGFFALSFVAGYVSLITPMGLGVREFVMAKGLVHFTSQTLAGFASLYARVLLIISEVIFLCFALFFYRVSISIPSRLTRNVQTYWHEYLLATSMVLYSIYFTTVSFLRYTNFFTGRFDLGNMDQTVWNTLHGKLFMLTDPNGTNVMSRLGTHADFILILLAPFYLIWEDPRTLLFIQTIVLALGALFIYLLTKDTVRNKGFALIFSLTYLLSPSIEYTNLYDFHAVTLATTFFLGAWYFLKKKKYLLMLVLLLLAGITKEEAWIVVGMFGVWITSKEIYNYCSREHSDSRTTITQTSRLTSFARRILPSLLLTIAPFVVFYLLVWKFIPLARGGQHFALSYYSDFGSTPGGVLKNIFLSPMKIVETLFSKERLIYLFQLFFPVGFLFVFAPQFLFFALPDLGINVLSSNTQLQQITFQYTAVITPFLFLATLYGVRVVTKRYKHVSLFLVGCWLLVCTLLSAYFFGPLLGASHPDIDVFIHQETDRSIIEGFLQDIPTNFTVAATNNIGSHLSHRQNIYTIPVGIDKADIVVFLLTDQFAQPSLLAQKQMAENLKHDKNYIEIFKENDFVVFEKRNLYTKSAPTIAKGKLYPAAIEALQKRDFEGGTITIQKTLQTTKDFTTILFSYPSDGLTLFGRADIPTVTNNLMRFPVVIINRGFIQSAVFQEETAYQNISESFASHGFLAVTPDYRNNGQSDKDRSIASILGYPIDVLNLINSLPNFPHADASHVFLWGFSVGGQVTLTALEAYSQNKDITPHLQAAAVWNAITDPYTAYTQFRAVFPTQTVPYQRVATDFGTFSKNPIPWQSVSPLYYLQDITTPIRISDAFSDPITPYQWSIELYDSLKFYHKNAVLALYNTDHNFTGTWKQVVLEDINYFQTFLKTP